MNPGSLRIVLLCILGFPFAFQIPVEAQDDLQLIRKAMQNRASKPEYPVIEHQTVWIDREGEESTANGKYYHRDHCLLIEFQQRREPLPVRRTEVSNDRYSFEVRSVDDGADGTPWVLQSFQNSNSDDRVSMQWKLTTRERRPDLYVGPVNLAVLLESADVDCVTTKRFVGNLERIELTITAKQNAVGLDGKNALSGLSKAVVELEPASDYALAKYAAMVRIGNGQTQKVEYEVLEWQDQDRTFPKLIDWIVDGHKHSRRYVIDSVTKAESTFTLSAFGLEEPKR